MLSQLANNAMALGKVGSSVAQIAGEAQYDAATKFGSVAAAASVPKAAGPLSTAAPPAAAESKPSIFTLSDGEILDLVYATHVHDDSNFDADSMFVVVESIIKRSNQIVDNLVQGNQVHVGSIDDKTPKASFTSPLCTLESICFELFCKPAGEEIAHKSALEILNKLSKYSWDTKALLVLAAFALDYGDFWLLAQALDQPGQLTKSLAILRRVTILLKPEDLQKKRQAIMELNNLIKATFQVIEILFELEKLTSYEPKDVPALAKAMDHSPVDVYWTIVTVVACSTKINFLTNEEEKPLDLAPYAQKIHYILNNLNIQLITCKKQIEEAESYRKLRKLFQTPTEIMEIFKALIFPKDNAQPILDGSTNQTVTIEVVRKKNVFLLITSLDITDEEISILRPIYEETKKNNQYTIVWIPIVDQWTDELKAKFETLCSKMPWYIVQYFSPISGIRFIKEEWQFKGKPIVVGLSPQGKVENPNALYLIKVWGVKAFPFDKTIEDIISKEKNWIGPVVNNIDPIIQTWIKEEKYIFFYGGKDNEWIQNFSKKVTSLAINEPIIKEAKISIELYCVGKTPKGGEDLDILGKFWTGIENLFLTKLHKQVDLITREIQKLLSYKDEAGWVLLTKGSTAVAAGHGLTILRVVEEFDKWKELAKENGFELAFVEHFNMVAQSLHYCSRLDVPMAAGNVPETMSCPECPRVMETFITYKCCHVDGPTNARQ